VDEGTGDEMEKRCINLEIHLIDTIDKCSIHNTNDESFHENIRYGTIHLVYTMKKIYVTNRTLDDYYYYSSCIFSMFVYV
jgi:hypothetical protein